MDETSTLALRLVRLWYHFTGIFFVIITMVMIENNLYALFFIFLLLAMERLGHLRDVNLMQENSKKDKK